MFGAMSGSVAVVSSLLAAGAKPHATNKQGRTAAQTAGFVGESCLSRVAFLRCSVFGAGAACTCKPTHSLHTAMNMCTVYWTRFSAFNTGEDAFVHK